MILTFNSRDEARLLAHSNDRASVGCREALAQVLEDSSALAGHDLGCYLLGLAHGLRVRSPKRRERAAVIQ